MRKIELLGQRFARLVVLNLRFTRKGHPYVCVRCDCGQYKFVSYSHLRDGHITSCGCYRREAILAITYRHGHATRAGRSATYNSWSSMRQRCLNSNYPQYRYYGGRGIAICSQWSDFNVFLRDMGPRPKRTSIDRINNNGNYEPTNCRWATPKQQTANRRERLKKGE